MTVIHHLDSATLCVFSFRWKTEIFFGSLSVVWFPLFLIKFESKSIIIFHIKYYSSLQLKMY